MRLTGAPACRGKYVSDFGRKGSPSVAIEPVEHPDETTLLWAFGSFGFGKKKDSTGQPRLEAFWRLSSLQRRSCFLALEQSKGNYVYITCNPIHCPLVVCIANRKTFPTTLIHLLAITHPYPLPFNQQDEVVQPRSPPCDLPGALRLRITGASTARRRGFRSHHCNDGCPFLRCSHSMWFILLSILYSRLKEGIFLRSTILSQPL